MILHESDWSRYPGARVHIETKNEHFKRIVAVYAKMGVRNHAFPLALLQPELAHVDPFDPDLDESTRIKIFNECRSNPWYYFREIASFTGAGGIRVKFEATRANISMFWCFFNHIDYYLIQPRQTGKTGSFSCLINYLMYVGCYKTDITFFTQNRTRLVGSIRELKELRSNLPEYVYFPNKEDSDNMHSLSCVTRKNFLTCRVGQKDPENAENAGRGSTTPVIGWDEFAFTDGNSIILPTAMPGVTTAREHAEKSGIPYGNIFMTTAGELSTARGRYAHSIMLDGTRFNEVFFDAGSEAKLIEMVSRNAGKKGTVMCVGTWNHRQLNRSDEWLRKRMELSRSTGNDAEKDFLNNWVTGGEESLLDREQSRLIQNSRRDADFVEITKEGYCISWYVPKAQRDQYMASNRLVIGLDTSEGYGGDNDAIGFVMIDVKTHDTVATMRLNQLNTMRFAEFLSDFLVKYKNTTLIFERKSTGIAIFDTLAIRLCINGINPFERVYNRIVSEPKMFPKDYAYMSRLTVDNVEGFLNQNRRYFGYATSGAGAHSRTMLYSTTMTDLLSKAAHTLYDQSLCAEYLGLRMRNGRVDHAEGSHDDLVIASLLAHWFLAFTTNLQHYGINSREIFAGLASTEEETDEQVIERTQNEELRDKFNEYYEELKETDDKYRKFYLEQNLRRLSERYNIEQITGNTLDQLLTDLEDSKEKNKSYDKFTRRSAGFSKLDPRRFLRSRV